MPKKFGSSWLCIICAAALTAAGCASTVPSADLSPAVARATAAAGRIEFRLVGEPVDVENPTGDVLMVAEAVRRALAHSPEIQAALARVRGAEADARQARLLPNPILRVVLRLPEGGGSPEIEAGLAADLISLLTRPGRTNAADSRLRAASADALSEVLDVLSAVQVQYVAIQTNDALLLVLQDRLRIIDRLLEVARSRLQRGFGTRLDVLSLEAQRVGLQTELADARLERSEARLQLVRMIGEPSGNIEWRVTPWKPYRKPFIAEPKWVLMGLENRPEVLRQRFELAALGAEYRLTRFAPFEESAVGAEAERAEGEWALGPAVSMPIPLFDFGQARRQKAQAALVEARHNLTRIHRQVVEETRRAYAAFAASRENLARVQSELIPLAQRRLDQAEAQFRGGQTDITGLLLAEQELQAARARLVELERRNTESLIRLQRAVGGPGVMPTEPAAATSPATQPVRQTIKTGRTQAALTATKSEPKDSE